MAPRLTIFNPGDEPDDELMGRFVAAMENVMSELAEWEANNAPRTVLIDDLRELRLTWTALMKDTEENL